jgi:hypothetical protein
MQNWQSTAHPACVEIQIVCRFSLGIHTASTDAGLVAAFLTTSSAFLCGLNAFVAHASFDFSPNPNKYRTDPSFEKYLCRTTGKVIVASPASFSRNSAGSTVIFSISKFLS